MDLHTVTMDERLDVQVSVSLTIGDLMPEACEKGAFDPFGSFISQRMAYLLCHVLNA